MRKFIKILSCAIFILLMCLISNTSFAQRHLNEKQVIENKHIDFSKEVIYFELSGLIEIDGHTFLNDTCKVKIVYIANLEGISILNEKTKQKYKVRKCRNYGCKIIHLVEDNPIQDYIITPHWPNSVRLNDTVTPADFLN